MIFFALLPPPMPLLPLINRITMPPRKEQKMQQPGVQAARRCASAQRRQASSSRRKRQQQRSARARARIQQKNTMPLRRCRLFCHYCLYGAARREDDMIRAWREKMPRACACAAQRTAGARRWRANERTSERYLRERAVHDRNMAEHGACHCLRR